MTDHDLLVLIPWFIFSVALILICIQLQRSSRRSRHSPAQPGQQVQGSDPNPLTTWTLTHPGAAIRGAARILISPAVPAIPTAGHRRHIAGAQATRGTPRSPTPPEETAPAPPRLGPRSAVALEAEPVAATQHGLDDLRAGGISLDLAAQVLHVRVDGPLIAVELIPADPVDQLES